MRSGLKPGKEFEPVPVEFSRRVVHVIEKDWIRFCSESHVSTEESTASLPGHGESWLSKLFCVNRFFVFGADESDHVEEE